MPPKPLPQLSAITPYKGGESALPGIAKPIKLASNENPLGASPAARAAIIASAERTHLYPDGGAVALREAIGARFDLDPARIVCGAGSDEIFQLLARAFLEPGDEIIQSEHAFLVYRLVAQQCGAFTRTAKDRALTADVDAMLALLTQRTKIVFLANPNNPTGTMLRGDDLRRLHAGLPEDVLLVIDAAYAEYVDDAGFEPGEALAREAGNVIVTRTFSKIHGLAALRVGYGYAPGVVVEALHRVRGPFNVSGPAQAAAIAALGDAAFVHESIASNSRLRAETCRRLDALGIAFTPGHGNFVLVHFPDAPGLRAADVDASLRASGVIVRAVGAYGLGSALRVSIGTEAEMDAFFSALTAFWTGGR